MEQGLSNYLQERAAMVEQTLQELLPAAEVVPGILHEAMRYSTFAGGKRLRPILCLAGAELVGGRPEIVREAACALEMIHTYSLIHDDLPCMDDDDLRRGRPTNHRVFGEAVAVLAGDALLTLAFQILATYPAQVPAERRCRVVQFVGEASGSLGMVGGQVLDLEGEGQRLSRAEMQQMHASKTGRLLRAALCSGGILAGASPREIKAMDDYAAAFGLAFQITDDILDVTGNVEKLGKAPGSDQRKEKATYPALFGLDASRRMAAEMVARATAALQEFGARAEILKQLAIFLLEREQ
ncbi:MAG: polyprenyl synthetase family protein [Bacillota bacterium]